MAVWTHCHTTLSVSISASTSPAANSSPSLFFHEAMLPYKHTRPSLLKHLNTRILQQKPWGTI